MCPAPDITLAAFKTLRLLHPHENESHLIMSDSLRPHGLHSPWNSPGHNTVVGSLSLLQGILDLLPKSTFVPKVHSLKLIAEI